MEILGHFFLFEVFARKEGKKENESNKDNRICKAACDVCVVSIIVRDRTSVREGIRLADGRIS